MYYTTEDLDLNRVCPPWRVDDESVVLTADQITAKHGSVAMASDDHHNEQIYMAAGFDDQRQPLPNMNR